MAVATTDEKASKKSGEKKVSSGHISEEVEDAIQTLPNMEISRLRHLYEVESDTTLKAKHQSALLDHIKSNNMAPFYQFCCTTYNWTLDQSLLSSMTSCNTAEFDKLDLQLTDATENLGDVEVLEALFAKATYHSLIGDSVSAITSAFSVASEKPQSISQKILTELHLIRTGLFWNDLPTVSAHISLAKTYIDEGGDWDRRNRLKVYEGCYCLMNRDFKKASTLFQESIATFTSDELMPFYTMVLYVVVTSVLMTSRVELKSKVVSAPEVLSVLGPDGKLPHVADFMNGLYDCDYKLFFTSIAALEETLAKEKYWHGHLRFIYRELRVLAYSQFLEAYKSVTMTSMASSFGVSVGFLDEELSRFISSGRLNAKIDKVDGIIETNRPDEKNTQYQETIQKGDHLLNRLQKLARVINV